MSQKLLLNRFILHGVIQKNRKDAIFWKTICLRISFIGATCIY